MNFGKSSHWRVLSFVFSLTVFLSPTLLRATSVSSVDTAAGRYLDGDLDHWIPAQAERSTSRMLLNVGPTSLFPDSRPGAVAASPSLSPYYRFHWVRDGALVMDTVLSLYEHASPASKERGRYLDLFNDFVSFSRQNQLTANPSGPAESLGLGEPKFWLDGKAFTGPWGRPQNDGPALRASAVIRFSHLLLDQGQPLSDLTRKLIQVDLDFVAQYWRASSFDLWEEVRGAHFYTRMVQRRALIEGAKFMARVGDAAAARRYQAEVGALESEISRHWDAGRGIIKVTLDQVEGLDYKSSGLDVAVVLGALHGTVPGQAADPFFSVIDDRVLATAQKLSDSFRRIYPVNGIERDWDHQHMAVAIGRYPEDRYSGVDNSDRGNPWFLSTLAFAELYYRAARAWQEQGFIQISSVNKALFKRIGAKESFTAEPGEMIFSTDPRFKALLRALSGEADCFMRRARFHADSNGSLSEQINRDNGFMQSAENLTWSHASLLTAGWARIQSSK